MNRSKPLPLDKIFLICATLPANLLLQLSLEFSCCTFSEFLIYPQSNLGYF